MTNTILTAISNKVINASLIIASSLLISTSLLAEQTDTSWSVKSTEKQFEQTSEKIEKSASGELLIQSMSKANATNISDSENSKNRQLANARTLTIRPNANNLDQTFWLYDAWITFHSDQDRDGFYNHFTVEFDADTEFNHAEVYARLYLAKGEVFKEYHSTSNFNIYADNNNDSFVVESELVTGFPSADYEVLIELYDAYNNQLVATLDGTNDADLYLLPLESANYEEVYVDQVVVIHESGGSLGWFSLLLVPLVALRKYFQ
ncbi:choice-of-anchor H family protein [Paraglaciecola aquimarina]|uniref:Choice-of-anchor H family protein n=1 Tax=Paraglaciecola algarum TaxID=3050085 RepID=A0ABS9DA08_9ALTE|nr:choice-of-anchor H family protein [Paraglaciecola sp. G1-23]MCF2949716.1 choice-of-anchor H family protein [Paraglaciecola sp. G1-23]